MPASAHDAAALEAQRGCFARALSLLPRKPDGGSVSHQQMVLAAELLRHTGNVRAATKEAGRILDAQGLSRALTSRCLVVLGLCAFDIGERRRGIALLRRAVRSCQDPRDTEARCHALLCLLAALSDVSAPGSLAALASDVRHLVSQLGLSTLGIRLHLVLGRADAWRGRIEQAGRHLLAARLLLDSNPNPWLEGRYFLDTSMVSCLRSDHADALERADMALACARKSGHRTTLAAACVQLGLLHLHQGNLARATHFFTRCARVKSRDCEVVSALLNGRAQLELFRGRHGECEALLDQIDAQQPMSRGFKAAWYQVSALRTRVRLRQKTLDWSASLKVINVGLEHAADRGDRLSDAALRLHKADALIGLDRLEEAAAVAGGVSAMCEACLPSLAAEMNRVKGSLLAKQGETAGGRRLLQRAVRVLSVVGSASALSLAEAALESAQAAAVGTRPVRGSDRGLVDAATLLDLPRNPELLGREALALIDDAGCAEGAALVVTSNGGPHTVLAHRQWTAAQALQITRSTRPDQRLAVGESRGQRFYLTVEARRDVASRDALAAIRTLIETAIKVENHRHAHRLHAALTPVGATDDPGAVFLSDQILRVAAEARRIASNDLPVLIVGETGTGKEILARLIHTASHRASRSFVAINCTGLTRGNAESQLFGHRRGAFTGAHEDAPGIIRGAGGGTLMLDEVGELDPGLQPKLLRFLESGEIQPVGEPKPVSADVRVIAATKAAIETQVRDGRFREDLFNRLNVLRLDVPPLRERREEIRPLARHFLRRHGRNLQRDQLVFSEDALSCLMLYDWPGNVRQLENEVRRVAALADHDETITPHHLPADIRTASDHRRDAAPPAKRRPPDRNEVTVRVDQPLSAAIEQVERAMIHRALRQADGRVNAAARLLGLSRKGLFLKRRRLGIETSS